MCVTDEYVHIIANVIINKGYVKIASVSNYLKIIKKGESNIHQLKTVAFESVAQALMSICAIVSLLQLDLSLNDRFEFER